MVPLDPITAGLTLANTIILLVTKIWDATPEPNRVEYAKEIALTIQHCSEFLHSTQDRVAAHQHTATPALVVTQNVTQ